MKYIIIFSGLLLLALMPVLSPAQGKGKLRIAVFDPAVTGRPFDEGTAVTVREMVSSVVVNTGKYTMIERSLINRIMEEQKFSNSGAVDESQASRLGKLAGANKIILSVLSSSGERALLSLKMIDVESASVESQKTKLVMHSELLDIIMSLTLELIGEDKPLPDVSLPPQSPKGTSKTTENNKQREESKPVQRNEPARRINQKEEAGFPMSSAVATGEDDFVLVFPGFSFNKNPEALVFVDGAFTGKGTLNEGFNLSVKDSRPGKHQVRIEWSGTVDSKTYNINTNARKRFLFEYGKTGFGYALRLKTIKR